MSIHELLAMIPADKLTVQFLHEGHVDVQTTKKGTRVSFYTGSLTPNNLMDDTAPIGVVIWISVEDWNRIVTETKGRKEFAE